MADKDKLRFLTGQEANLKDKTLTRGQVYFAISSDTDSGKIYFDAPIDNNTTKRILMSSDHAKTADKATAADRATADSNGHKFTETYVSEIKLDNAGTTILYKYPDITKWKELKPKFLPLTGGTITGELYADSITAGDLLVNGSARFVNTILGNIETADQWKTARGFQIADSDAAHTSVTVNVNGSSNVVLKLPSTIKAALQGNADTATKATNDSNNKKITDEYLHRVSNTSSTLNQFSGAPKYLLGIESFTDGGEVKWQSVDSVKVGSASGADKWNTAVNFQVSDSDAAHTGTAVPVNGSKAIVLPLPATIKATLEGNASSANKVNHKYTLTLGSTAQTAFDGSADVAITITPKSIGALASNANAVSASKWSSARTFYVADSDASNTGEGVSVDGSKDITLKLPSTIKAAITGHASEDLSLAGGTMTGNISYKGSKATNSMIRFLNNTTDASGNGISIGGGGVTVIGAGESSQNLTPAANEEALYLTSDGNIKFYTYCDTIGNKRGVILDTSRNFYPDVNNSGSIGTSSNKWASVYATTFYGALSGTASHATSDIRGNAIINTYLTNVYAKSDDSSYLYKQVGPSSERSAELIGRYTPLDSDGLINMKYIPAAALERVVVEANQTAQYALTTANVQLGDVVKRNDTGQLYFVVDTNNLSNAGGYLQFTAGTATNVNWSGILNRPNVVGSATGNAIVPNAANTEFTVYQVNGNGTSTSYVIKPNFLPKTGGTITGELSVDGETTLANLIVNGDASFVNIIQGSISGNAGSATKWATAKAFYIADAEAKHTSSPQVNIDGSQSSYTLKLPSTIKATLEGNADTATKLTNLTEADKASSTNTWRRVWFAYDDNVNGRPAYSDTFAYQSSTGTVKATKFQGALVGNATSADKWSTARNFITNLGSETSASVDGSTGPYNLGVTGTLPVSHGGTGVTTIAEIKAGKDADGNTITSKYVSIYNSNNIGSSRSVTVNDLAKQGSAVGMIYAATDNPFGKESWVHVWSQAWNKTVNTSWVSQIALGVDESDGMWYRTKEGTIVGASWTRVIDSNNYNNYAVKKASSSTDNALVRWDGTTGQAIQNSTATLSDEGHLSVSGKINSNGDITIGSMNGETVIGAGNFKIGVKNDSYGVMPYANNWNSIGSSNLYWYRAYVTNYYGTTSHIINYDSNGNIGAANTSSAAATLGYINFYNNAAAGATQTKTKLTANSGATTNLTITLPKTDGMLLNEGNYNDFAVKKASSSTDNAIVRWDGTDGRRIQNSLLSINDKGLLTLQTGNHIGAKLGSAYITSADANSGEIVLQNGHLRFGSDSWDYNQWAGLKYVHSSKIIYLGLADGTIFHANSGQSGGTLALPGIRYFSINGKIAIDANDGWLRINEGKAFATGVYFGSNVVRTDGQLQVGDSGNKFYANSSGNGYFSNTLGIGGTNTSYKLYVNGTSYINGNTTVNGWLKVQNTTDSKNSQDSNASLAIQGGVSVAKQLSAKTIRIDGSSSDTIGSTTQGCTVHFNKTNNCIEFVFD